MQKEEKIIITPEKLKTLYPLSTVEQKEITISRQTISQIIQGSDKRILVVCGPCSIHDITSALDYAHRLKILSDKLNDHLYFVMRVYFEKPRTTIGWKGLINDPYMDGSCDIEAGLKLSRNLLMELVKIGLPLATEFLDINNLHYISDLFSWSAIGARTTESQVHREIVSGLNMPVGFKNRTDGSVMPAINAMIVAQMSHYFTSINQSGQLCLMKTKGNANTHLILRGGNRPNYYPQDIANYEKQMIEAGVPAMLMIDCSHGNSQKDHRSQSIVLESVLEQIKSGNQSIFGIMLESYIHAGNQPIRLPRTKMKYGVSVTDACMDWDNTYTILHHLHKELKTILPTRQIQNR